MKGSMMVQPLLISSLIEHAEKYHGDTEIFSKNLDGSFTTTNWLSISKNSKSFANALKKLELDKFDRVATLAWNNYRHLECWYAISGSGLICHTINPRLSSDQIIFIIKDANDKVLLFDKSFLPLINSIKEYIPNIEFFIYLGSFDQEVKEILPSAQFYDSLIEENLPDFIWPEFEENSASSLCYTSGTTGNPKGVLYSHRSTILHTFAICLPDSMHLSARDVIMPVVPMFHVNAWGTPYAAAMVGASLVLPGSYLDGTSLIQLIDKFNVTIALGVPTIWQNLLQATKKSGSTLKSLKRNVVGGAACTSTMIESFKNIYHCETIHAWGMTETSPLGTANQLKYKHRKLPKQDKLKLRLSQGRPIFGINLRITIDENNIQSNKKAKTGNLQIKGHWVINNYYGKTSSPLTLDGWFDTGDIAHLDEDSYLTISDRAKDLIKSGGEWISSVELENIAMDHPEIKLAAIIAAKHPLWDERPVLIAVKEKNSLISENEILNYYIEKVNKIQIPDKVVFVDSIPISGTGKILKRDLREKFKNVLIDSQQI